MKARCYDPDFKYIPASATDISKTFAKERKRLAELAKLTPASNVKAISPKKTKVL